MQFSKSFGQHILKNPLVINGIVEKASMRCTARAASRPAQGRAEVSAHLAA